MRDCELVAVQMHTTDAIQDLLFQRLPNVCSELLSCTEAIYFFNEHYVVKPPQSNVEFKWHRVGSFVLSFVQSEN